MFIKFYIYFEFLPTYIFEVIIVNFEHLKMISSIILNLSFFLNLEYTIIFNI